MADHPGGGEDRPLRLRGARAVLRRPDRADAADRQRGAVLGRRRDRHGDHGHDARRRRRSSPAGTPEQIGEWVPQCYGTPDEPKVGAFCVSEPDAGSDVSSLRTRARYDEAKDEWVLNGQKAWATNGGIANVHVVVASRRPRARLARPGRRSSSRPARQGLDDGHEGQEARPARLAHRRRLPRRLPRPRPLPARRQGEARRAPRPRPRGHARQAPGGDADLRGDAPDRRRAGDRHRPRRLRVRARLRQGARAVRPPDHREPGDRVRARRHEDGDRRRAAARLARVVDGPHRPAVRRAPRAR